MKLKSTLVILILCVFTLDAQAGWFKSLVHAIVNIVVQIPIIGNAVDSGLNTYAHKKLDAQINAFLASANACSPREMDGPFDANFFMTQKPGFPGWQDLEKLKNSSQSITDRGISFSTYDKVRHCYVGCTIRKEIGYGAAVLAAWLKELQDASDCSSSTHFELADRDATVGGAIAGGKTSCESFCGRTEFVGGSGSDILEAANSLRIPNRYVRNNRNSYKTELE